ncbi:uncharacterized protein NPIL_568061 [Nephila pilipes]|uniref:DUF4304 domain-containing protein n=1 Tax=Nephila pilipes TaxID=299642 RepID=A0A8X6MIH9_NEPPI|nr:uncharacterized protein NPIL_568061 [Nephila pilipes]
MSQEVFKQFMELMKPFMKSHGFTKKNNNFYKRHPQGNVGIINFQKDRRSGSSFTINVSTYSYALAEFFLGYYGEKEVKKYPSAWDGHWCAPRIDSLIPSSERVNLANSKSLREIDKRFHGDLWWRLYYYEESSYTIYDIDAKELFDEVSPLIAKFAIPAIDQHLTDEQLKIWLEDIGNISFSAILLLALGEKEKLKTVLNKLLKDVQDPSVSNWLKADYDRIVKASGLDKEGFNLSGVVNFPPGKDRLSKEELLALYDSLREEDDADSKARRNRFMQLFSKVITLATPLMESQGFTQRKRSYDFCKRYSTEDVGIINFRTESLKLCISAGVYSHAGVEFGLANYEKEIVTHPRIIDCHWSVDSITSLGNKQSMDYGNIKDAWIGDCWECDSTVDVESLSHKIVHLITKVAIPVIDQLVANPQFHDAVIAKLKRMHDVVRKLDIRF